MKLGMLVDEHSEDFLDPVKLALFIAVSFVAHRYCLPL
jgi:hypothetical protein